MYSSSPKPNSIMTLKNENLEKLFLNATHTYIVMSSTFPQYFELIGKVVLAAR